MTLSVGIVGAGEIARKIHIPVLLNTPRVKISWIADIDPDRANAVGSAYGVPPISTRVPGDLPACDVVLLAIPVNTRGAYLEHFARTGTAVFCEKPFAASSTEHQELLEMFPPYRLGCGFMRRFYSSSLLMRKIVREGWLGALTGVRISEGNRSRGSGVDQSFLDDQRAAAFAGALADLGSHTIDLALYISGAETFEVESVDLILDGQIDRKICASVKLMLSPYMRPEGAMLEYCISWLDRQANLIELQFAKASIWAPIAPGAQVFLGDFRRPAGAIALLPEARGATTANQAFFLEWQSFLNGLEAGQESNISARSSLLTTALVEQLYAKGGLRRA